MKKLLLLLAALAAACAAAPARADVRFTAAHTIPVCATRRGAERLALYKRGGERWQEVIARRSLPCKVAAAWYEVEGGILTWVWGTANTRTYLIAKVLATPGIAPDGKPYYLAGFWYAVLTARQLPPTH